MTHKELTDIFEMVEEEMQKEQIAEKLLTTTKTSIPPSATSPIEIATFIATQAMVGYNNVFLFKVLSKALCKD